MCDYGNNYRKQGKSLITTTSRENVKCLPFLTAPIYNLIIAHVTASSKPRNIRSESLSWPYFFSFISFFIGWYAMYWLDCLDSIPSSFVIWLIYISKKQGIFMIFFILKDLILRFHITVKKLSCTTKSLVWYNKSAFLGDNDDISPL